VLQDDTTLSFTPVEPHEEAAEETPSPGSDLLPGQALIVVKRGPNAGSTFLMDQDLMTLGRLPESDLFLDDVTVSRRHAELRREGTQFTIHDVGSLNGTYVNMQRVDETELADEDEIQIGKFKLAFYIGHEARD
jgi:pSer/pThr/pTyr-binding forkhead associated (FHA) protein